MHLQGGALYLQAQLKSKTEILREEISFFVKGTYLHLISISTWYHVVPSQKTE